MARNINIMFVCRIQLTIALVACCVIGYATAFATPKTFPRALVVLGVARYGPPSSSFSDDDDSASASAPQQKRKLDFKSLFEESMAITNPEHLPRHLANNVQLIMSLQGAEGTQVVSELLAEAQAEGPEQYQRTVDLVDVMLSFAEDFVEQASDMDSQNKLLLGKIVRTMTGDYNDDDDNNINNANANARVREELLDVFMEDEKQNFTPGFLRHLEGECERIVNAPRMSPESARLLEILRIIQARVLEELGKDMGEGALVLGQLMGYDDRDELLGVLEAGLTVRGTEFALEMAALTEEALGGFQRVPGGVDPELVERVTFIDQRLREFLEETNGFQ